MSKSSKSDAPILVTMGEPAGIGPEVAVAAYAALGGRVGARTLKLIGDPDVFRSVSFSGDVIAVGAKATRVAKSERSAAGHSRMGAAKYQTTKVSGSHANTVTMKRASGDSPRARTFGASIGGSIPAPFTPSQAPHPMAVRRYLQCEAMCGSIPARRSTRPA